jgi:stage V sporulation protein D (sporulation-specific penicillin-binding protein)
MNPLRKRIYFFYIILTLLMVALVGRLVYIQVFWSDELTELAKAQQNKNIIIPAERGSILDRNGDKLAFSIKTYSVWAQPSEITKPNETAALIGDVLGIEYDGIINSILTAKSTFVKVVANLTKSEADLVRGKGIGGISITEDTKRLYPYNTLAAHIVGIVNLDGDGLFGLELWFNETLKGKPGLYHVTTDVYGRQLAYGEDNLEAPENGNAIMLTLDDSIQFFVEDRLETALEQHMAQSVTAIVMDPNTGEILAMASKPDFDLNKPRTHGSDMDESTWSKLTDDEKLTYWNEMWKNKTISNTFEPGSTFKALISAIALEEQLFTLESTFYCEGVKLVNGVPLHCVSFPDRHGHQTFVQAFVNSCNPAFIEIGQKIGVERLYDYLNKFGLLEKTNIALPAEAKSISQPKDKVGPIELATMSYGHGINMTMLQMVRIMSALVNGGNLLEPLIVKSVIDSEGNVIEVFEPKVEAQIISAATSEKLKFLLESAVKSGGGKKAYIEGIRVGGKSGTSQKFTENGYEDEVVVVSFMGIAPMEDPQYVVLVVVDEPKDQFLGSLVAAPITKGIIEDILRYKNIAPEVTVKKDVEIPNLIGMTLEQAMKTLDDLELTYSTTPLGIEDLTLPVTNQFPAAGTKVDGDSMVIISVEE